jgi:hypothetical protein
MSEHLLEGKQIPVLLIAVGGKRMAQQLGRYVY